MKLVSNSFTAKYLWSIFMGIPNLSIIYKLDPSIDKHAVHACGSFDSNFRFLWTQKLNINLTLARYCMSKMITAWLKSWLQIPAGKGQGIRTMPENKLVWWIKVISFQPNSILGPWVDAILLVRIIVSCYRHSVIVANSFNNYV